MQRAKIACARKLAATDSSLPDHIAAAIKDAQTQLHSRLAAGLPRVRNFGSQRRTSGNGLSRGAFRYRLVNFQFRAPERHERLLVSEARGIKPEFKVTLELWLP